MHLTEEFVRWFRSMMGCNCEGPIEVEEVGFMAVHPHIDHENHCFVLRRANAQWN